MLSSIETVDLSNLTGEQDETVSVVGYIDHDTVEHRFTATWTRSYLRKDYTLPIYEGMSEWDTPAITFDALDHNNGAVSNLSRARVFMCALELVDAVEMQFRNL